MRYARLLSDMSSFKSANPGCCLEDFSAWQALEQQQQQQAQAPQQVLQQQREERPEEAPPSHAAAAPAADDLARLWSVAPPLPASSQRPLLQPVLAGEGVLHYLETLPPGPLFGQLLGLAMGAALGLLAGSAGAALAPAAEVVERFRTMAAGVLAKGGGLPEARAAAAAAAAAGGGGAGGARAGEALLSPGEALAGFTDAELELLLAEFAYMEQVVVLAESLLQRLPGQAAMAAAILRSAIGSGDGAHAGARVAAAALDAPQRAQLAAWLATGVAPSPHAAGREPLSPMDEPVQCEWLVNCAPAGAAAAAAAAGGAAGRVQGGPPLPPPSRLYVQESAGEMRLALTLVSQPGL